MNQYTSMSQREWLFVSDSMAKVRDWISNWLEISPKSYLLKFHDLHKDDNKDFVCMIEVISPIDDLSNMVFYCRNGLYDIDMDILQRFGN